MARRKPAGSSSVRAKLTNEQAVTILERATAGERNSVLAREFGVSESALGRLVAGKTWPTLHASRLESGRNRGIGHSRAKMDESKVRAVRRGYAEGKLYRELAEAEGVSIRTVFNIVQRRTWKHVD